MDLLLLPQKFTACCNGIADMGQVTVKWGWIMCQTHVYGSYCVMCLCEEVLYIFIFFRWMWRTFQNQSLFSVSRQMGGYFTLLFSSLTHLILMVLKEKRTFFGCCQEYLYSLHACMWKGNQYLKIIVRKCSVGCWHFVLMVCSHNCDVCGSTSGETIK